MIALDKTNGINLKKGTSINLEKDGRHLEHVCVGLNWGAIPRTGFLGSIMGGSVAVDLDGAVSTFSGDRLHETVYYNHLYSIDGSIRHTGDDLTGDLSGDDGLDNEVITIDLRLVSPSVDRIFIYLNSYKEQDFGEIPYSKLRIYEGTANHVEEVLATFNLSVDPKFGGFTSMIMGRIDRTPAGWKFTTIGEPVSSRNIPEIAQKLKKGFQR